MNKTNIYKGLKILFFLAGFPLLLILMIATMAPMFGEEAMGDYARNWVLLFFGIWLALLIIGFVLEKFVGKKSLNHHRMVLIAMSGLSILCVLLPSVFYDVANKQRYEDAYNALENKNSVKSYNSVMGWHRDFTSKHNSEVYSLIYANYDFMKMYGLSSVESSWYANADKENGIGYKYGSKELSEILTREKLEAKANYEAAKAELEAIEKNIADKKAALASAEEALKADGANAELIAARDKALAEYNAIIADTEDDLVRLKGVRVDISNYKDEIANLLVTIIKDPAVLPDGLTINIAGIELPVDKLLDLVLSLAGGSITPEAVSALIPDVIYTGIGDQTVATYEKAVNGSDTDLSLESVQAFNFKLNYYPETLAAGAMRYACYISVGLIVLSIFMTDYFAGKEKEEKNENKQ